VSPVSAVTIRGGKIVDVADRLPAKPRYPLIDYKYAVISPGIIDVHVHMNEPGREAWEGEYCSLKFAGCKQAANLSTSSSSSNSSI
jgi:dihydroorotase-like cyclic amidohydrolase